MEPEDVSHWFALRTRSRAEKVVHEQLRHRGLETLLPLVTKVSQWKDRKKRIEWPLFPGYCFARFKPAEKLTVLQSPGVVEIIGSARDQAEPVSDAEIAALQRLVAARKPAEPYPSLIEGMEVEVIRGPLAGIRGKLIRKGNHCRLILAINVIRQGAAVEIQAEDVLPVDPSPSPGGLHVNSA
ncbi:UpxY family transcription antiterminator [Candidatus Nitrospira bockiana]